MQNIRVNEGGRKRTNICLSTFGPQVLFRPRHRQILDKYVRRREIHNNHICETRPIQIRGDIRGYLDMYSKMSETQLQIIITLLGLKFQRYTLKGKIHIICNVVSSKPPSEIEV